MHSARWQLVSAGRQLEQLDHVAVWVGGRGNPATPRFCRGASNQGRSSLGQALEAFVDIATCQIDHQAGRFDRPSFQRIVDGNRQPVVTELEVDEVIPIRSWLKFESLDIELPHRPESGGRRVDQDSCERDGLHAPTLPGARALTGPSSTVR